MLDNGLASSLFYMNEKAKKTTVHPNRYLSDRVLAKRVPGVAVYADTCGACADAGGDSYAYGLQCGLEIHASHAVRPASPVRRSRNGDR